MIPDAERELAEHGAMLRALDLAGSGVRGANPLVGAVVLDRFRTVIGEGAHNGAGTPHAEPAALADARSRGNDVDGGTMVVTLEPCSHTGRTGPCCEAVYAAGIRRVVYAATDTNTEAAGGAAWLRSRAVECSGGVLAAAAGDLNSRWARSIAEGRPFVTLKTAGTLDGRVAAPDGTSQWITGPQARADGHTIRARADAVLVGTGTVLADDPRLTARPGSDARQPLRVVMGLREPPDDAAIRGPGFLHLATRDVNGALDQLMQRGVRHLMVEGGPTIAGAFLHAGVVDEIFSYVAPIILGDGKPLIPSLGISTLAAASRWRFDPAGGVAVQQLGADLRLHLRPEDDADGPAPPAVPLQPPSQTPTTQSASRDQEPPCSQE
ncbi:bifunctional diaminohydroxyphosphoribosylaminopyrimidine deaminase/5-amino-6-(5-phosphoribosylamino)uracil reductase RibD [Arthrobacter sp. H41]|uniref:bifunctional diaminohydroxyphosphoribosylaminopyrimidine deaminase/5-amino-6-(5-phosphoribosylamino)uracil reductase RibD n=1 Tax=Arthrobacter sp. H41 TaxID=1312978 RepID=UPI0004BA8D43|nr:bifunctional diaminohydroxyphosphoribosylaminopyrimidine deaminase/5-amino-6-(5-phosphoribosylamino)uracil reductase RibD [Arthrobacter sp. H41]